MATQETACLPQGGAPHVGSGRTFDVLVGRKDGVEAALGQLAKRAARKGLAPLTWLWGRAFRQLEIMPDESRAYVSRVPLTIEGAGAHYAGWTFVAALQHLDGENVMRAMPGVTLDPTWRTAGPKCDHCRVLRRRNDTFVLRHDDGRLTQVGSTCVADFLGSHEADKLAAQATMLAAARAVAEDGCEGFGGAGADRTLAEFLPIVAWSVRAEGWTSRTVARESNKRATADAAWTYLVNDEAARKAECDPSADDAALAASAEAWAESLTDAQVNAESGDYLHNVRAIARTGLATFKTAGLGASMIVAYQRAIGRERERAARLARPKLDTHLGTVGKRETWTVVLDFVTGYETAYGYTTVLKFRTDEGGILTWKASSTDLTRADVGKRYALKGTVKKHDEYKGEKQTLLSRCAVTLIETEERQAS